MSENGHDHGHPPGHPHEELRHESSPWAARIRAVEELLVEKGLLTREEIDERAAALFERWGKG